MNENIEKINCFHCAHFALTWEPKFPKACKLFGIKSARMPSVVVFNSSGEPCNGFINKNTQT
ncbi:MAG: uracil-DNA glycosylase [Oscillospiraceae bacterium]|nr:uracil-DNA glycosylase [Oscillospiraceae bacterium]